MTEHINYAEMVNNAMRSMIREVLHIAEEGEIPGEHHFYITFLTSIPGVKIPAQLRKQFPDEMTIVLQHEYDNLTITEKRFSVDLKFNGISRNLVIPFHAIIAFADPSSKFALHFEAFDGTDTIDDLAEDTISEEHHDMISEASEEDTHPGEVISLDKYRKE